MHILMKTNKQKFCANYIIILIDIENVCKRVHIWAYIHTTSIFNVFIKIWNNIFIIPAAKPYKTYFPFAMSMAGLGNAIANVLIVQRKWKLFRTHEYFYVHMYVDFEMMVYYLQKEICWYILI